MNISTLNKPSLPSTRSISFPSFQKPHNSILSTDQLLPFSAVNLKPKKFFAHLDEKDINHNNAHLWLAFDTSDLKVPLEDLLDLIKDQFETNNIVKIDQAYHLQPACELQDLLITGWKLFDRTIRAKILAKSKPLTFTYNNLPLKYHLIGPLDELKRFLWKKKLDQKLKKIKLFSQEYATPLLSLHLQGLFYYEFDYVDISPDTTFVLCGVPPEISDSQLTSYIIKSGLPEPINILRNPLEGATNIRITFSKESDADLFKFQGLKIPIRGKFRLKPIIVLPVKDRSFDFCSEITKYQVLLKFEGDTKLEEKDQIQVLQEIQGQYGYGPISDVTIVYSQLWVISFQDISSPVRCLETSQPENFSFKVSFSKPAKPYPCSGFLFQHQEDLPFHNTELPERPPKLVKTDPNALKIQSEVLNNAPLLKRRYQKIYLRQFEEVQEQKENQPSEVDVGQVKRLDQEEIKAQSDEKGVKENRRKKAKARKIEIIEEKENNKIQPSGDNELEIIDVEDQLMMTKKKMKTGAE